MRKAIALLVLIAFTAIGGPVIELSEIQYDAGTIKEGTQKIIKHRFIVKNTGDEKLVIKKVRVSCGCTVVKHDSVIRPGKSGIVEPEVDISGYSGEVEKSVTIESNAVNSPSLRLALKVTIRPIIGISQRFLRIRVADSVAIQLTLTTDKPDFVITGVDCKPLNLKDRPQWQKSAPVLRYTLTGTGQADEQGMYKYAMSVLADGTVKQSMIVEIIFNTNHPEKKELRIRGIIE